MCQTVQDVERDKAAPRLREHGLDDNGDVYMDNNPFDYVVVEHYAWGKRCAGSGDSPQALTPKKA